jgi:hypothetical protein
MRSDGDYFFEIERLFFRFDKADHCRNQNGNQPRKGQSGMDPAALAEENEKKRGEIRTADDIYLRTGADG